MVNTISPYFDDELVESQLMDFFSLDEMYTINFKLFFNTIIDVGEYLEMNIRGRIFYIDKETGTVTEKNKKGV